MIAGPISSSAINSLRRARKSPTVETEKVAQLVRLDGNQLAVLPGKPAKTVFP